MRKVTTYIARGAAIAAALLSLSSCPQSLGPLADGAEALSRAASYNYVEALQKSIMFYEFQRSGDIDEATVRNNWRGDSGMADGASSGVDLTGGWYDAGDHVKFNLPMAYSVSMLAWSVVESREVYAAKGELDEVLDNIKWAADYLVKCHTAKDEYYYQVGEGGADHSWWGPAEAMQMGRPAYKVTLASPGSTVVAETAAALASASIAFRPTNPAYAATLLQHAKELFDFADRTKSDAGYTAANGFYNSWSGFYDELSFAGAWLYQATGDAAYLAQAEGYVANWGTEPQTTTIAYKWGHCWDDVHYGAQLLLARATKDAAKKALYKESMERHLGFWMGGGITVTPKGLAWLSQWGSLRYATTTAFLAGVYADWAETPAAKAAEYKAFAAKQVDYALGSTGRSFLIGFGTNPPLHPHHRTAHSSWADSQTVPLDHRHTLVGALVGGPNASDGYTDSIGDYVSNEVACDYNAGFVGILAKMAGWHGGTAIAGLKAIEPVAGPELFVAAGINASGPNFVEIKALVNNQSGWPARVTDKLSFRYFLDLSEFFAAGYTEANLTVGTNYNQGATVTGPFAWDAAKRIYYVKVDFTGTKVYPGGQSAYKKEVQFRISGPQNSSFWNSANDYSFAGLPAAGASPVVSAKIPIYDAGKLAYGTEPSTIIDTTPPAKPAGLSAMAQGQAAILLDWADNAESDLAGYRVYRSLTAGVALSAANLVAAPSASTLANTGLVAGTRYYYAVVALDSSGNASLASAEASATTDAPDTTPPAIPAGLAAAAIGQTKINLAWVKNSETDLAKYRVYRSTVSTFSPGAANLIAEPLTNSYADSGLTANTTYYYAVAAVDASGNASATSAKASAKTEAPDTTPPAAPKALAAVAASSSAINLDWADNAESDLAGYRVYKSLASPVAISAANLVGSPAASALAATGLAADTLYYFAAVALDASGNASAASAEVSARTQAAPAGAIKVEFFNGNLDASGNTISGRFRIKNTGSQPVKLSDITVKYFFTKDAAKPMAFWCDHAGGMVGGNYMSLTSSVVGSFIAATGANADTALVISFAASSPELKGGDYLEIQTRVARTDWSNFTQTNDYSFSSAGQAYVEYQKVCAYVGGKKVWGVEPL